MVASHLSSGQYCSLPHGPVISPAFALANKSAAGAGVSFWAQQVAKNGNEIGLIADPGEERLSKDELNLVDLVFAKYGHWSPWDVRSLTHREFGEWTDPGASSYPIPVDEIFRAVGRSEGQIAEFAEDLAHVQAAKSILGR